MKVKAIGKRKGVSKKSGKAYLQVTFLSPMIGGEGEAGDSLFLDPDEYKYGDIQLGKQYEAEFSRNGYLVAFRQSV